ncbi:MAG: hypothetical protein ACRERC_20105 [Candidatus Binatia bacterium]
MCIAPAAGDDGCTGTVTVMPGAAPPPWRVRQAACELVVTREPTEHHAHEDLYVAIRDAFDAAQRRPEDHARRQRGAVKAHQPPRSARSE